jgi:predicted phage tail protein
MRNLIFLVGLLGLIVGCGPGGNTIIGKVTLDDGSAAPRGTVTLRNDAGSFRGAIGADGTYTIENIAAGTYAVAVTGVTNDEVDPQAGMAFDQATGQYTSEAAPPPKPLIKAIYFNPTTSGLSLTVPSESYDLKLERDDGAQAPAAGGSS